MALTSKNQLLAVFKKLSNKSHTSSTKGILNEATGSSVQLGLSTIFAESISSTPPTTSNGVAEKVIFLCERIDGTDYANNILSEDGEDSTVRFHAYKLNLPLNYSTTSTNTKKGTAPFISNAAVCDSYGALQLIPPSYGSAYSAVIKAGSTIIPPLDAIDYYLDYYSGILFIQDGDSTPNNTPTTVEAYLYIGKYADIAGPSGTAGGILSGSYPNPVAISANSSNIIPLSATAATPITIKPTGSNGLIISSGDPTTTVTSMWIKGSDRATSETTTGGGNILIETGKDIGIKNKSGLIYLHRGEKTWSGGSDIISLEVYNNPWDATSKGDISIGAKSSHLQDINIGTSIYYSPGGTNYNKARQISIGNSGVPVGINGIRYTSPQYVIPTSSVKIPVLRSTIAINPQTDMTMSAKPTLTADGTSIASYAPNGYTVKIINFSDKNICFLNDTSTIPTPLNTTPYPSSSLKLGASQRVLSKWGCLELTYQSTGSIGDNSTEHGYWVETSFTNNLSSSYLTSADLQNYVTNANLTGYLTTADATNYAKLNAANTFAQTQTFSGSIQQDGCEASGQDSHAQGLYTKAIGNNSHAEGFNSNAIGDYSHAEGNSKSFGVGSHAEGFNTITSGNYSHASGYYSTAKGPYSTAIGDTAISHGTSSIAIGKSAEAKFDNQVVIGQNYTLDGASFIVGGGAISQTPGNAISVYSPNQLAGFTEGNIIFRRALTSSNGIYAPSFIGNFEGDGSKIINLPLTDYAKSANVSSSFVLKTDVGSVALKSEVSGAFAELSKNNTFTGNNTFTQTITGTVSNAINATNATNADKLDTLSSTDFAILLSPNTFGTNQTISGGSLYVTSSTNRTDGLINLKSPTDALIKSYNGVVNTQLGASGTGLILGTTTSHPINFQINGTAEASLDVNGNFVPRAANVNNLGATLTPWNTVYSNIVYTNEIRYYNDDLFYQDGTWTASSGSAAAFNTTAKGWNTITSTFRYIRTGNLINIFITLVADTDGIDWNNDTTNGAYITLPFTAGVGAAGSMTEEKPDATDITVNNAGPRSVVQIRKNSNRLILGSDTQVIASTNKVHITISYIRA